MPKAHADIALGVIVGSNVFNLLIISVPGLLGPLALDSEVFNRDWLFTLSLVKRALCLASAAQSAGIGTGTGELGRVAGVVLLGTYISYLTILVVAPDLAG